MIISKKAKDYIKENNLAGIVIGVKRDENFSGCGCSSKSVVTYSPKADFIYGELSSDYIKKELDGISILIHKDVESTLTDDSKIDLIGIFHKGLIVDDYTPRVVREP